MVAVLELIQRTGGFLHSSIASPSIRVVSILDLSISALFFSLYRQSTDLPARLISRSAFSKAFTIPVKLFQCISPSLRDMTTISYPIFSNRVFRYFPINPVPPAMTIFFFTVLIFRDYVCSSYQDVLLVSVLQFF